MFNSICTLNLVYRFSIHLNISFYPYKHFIPIAINI